MGTSTSTKQSWALQFVHIKYINDQLEQSWHSAPTMAAKREIANVATANLTLWLGMFRWGENFNLRRSDVTVVRPEDGPTVGLSPGIGVIEMRMSPETKSSLNKTMDVVISYHCMSGLCLGLWMERLLSFEDSHGKD